MALLVLAGTVFNTLVIAWLARRILGTPVGWPRTILIGFLTTSFAPGLLDALLPAAGLSRDAFDASASQSTRATAALVSTVLVAWLLAAGLAALTVLEVLVPTGTLPAPVALVRSIPLRFRRGRRYSQILALATKHGLGAYLRPGRPNRPASSDETSAVARHLRQALTEGGVTFVKLGQMLGTRADLLPPAFVAELGKLHSDVPAEPWPVIRAVLEEELARPLDEVFASIEEEPLAAASVAQVHRATLHTGEPVVIKVQRPRARASVTADLDIVERLGARLQRTTDWGRRMRTADLATGLGHALREELDYRIELANMEAVAATSGGAVAVPRTYPRWCTDRVLIMEQVRGMPLSRSADRLARTPGPERRRLADELFANVLRQITVGGVFHADLHPGNIVWEEDRLVLLDFGSVGRLDRAARDSLGLLLLAFERQDSLAATDALIDLLGRPDNLADRRLERELGELLLRGGDTVAVFSGLFGIVAGHGFAVPPMVAAAFRAFSALDGTLATLSPGFDAVAAAREMQGGVLAEQFAPAQVRERLESQLALMLLMLQRLPRRLDRIGSDLADGRFSIQVRALAHPDDRAFLTGIVQQVVTAILAATCTLGAILLAITPQGPHLAGEVRLYPMLGALLGFFGFALAARLLALVFRQHSR